MDGSWHGPGWLVKESRRQLGVTQQELADRAGISLGTVRDLEQGRSTHPRPRSLDALADALRLDPTDRASLHRMARPRESKPRPKSGPVRISVLGPLAVSRSSTPVPLGSGRHRAVLARLAVTPNHPVSRTELIDLLWPEEPPASAPNILQTHVGRLRRILGSGPDGAPGMLTLTPGGYRLQVDHEQLDLLAYQSRLAQARRVSAVDPQQGFDILSAALDLWQGHSPVQDVAEMHGDPLFIALCDDMIDATLQLGQLAEALQRLPEVLPRLRRLAARHVWHEGLHARLIVALAVSGQRAAGFDVYDGIRRRLLDDLGVDPGPELVKARQGLVNQRGEEAHRTAVVTQPHRMAWQAPASPASFTGRADELLRLERLLRFSERRSGAHPTTLCVISGMPGVGKTSLALRAAQSVRADFPDGQLYLDLRGADDDPFTITAALAGLLRGLGVEGSGIPEDADEARAVYRSVLTHRRALIILDNARDAAQVRSLLPGPSPSAVLVTSRNQCTDLEAATHVALPVLTAQEALDLLCRHVGSARVAAERQTAEALVQACGHLPLALGVIASRLASRPRWTLRSMLDRLVDTRTRLDKLDVGDVMVTASFDLSCRELSSWSTEVFQAAAQIPGETFSMAAVAALLGVDDRPVGRTLDELVDENMLQAVGSRRYRYHDLLRLYAVRRAADRKRADDQDGPTAGSTPVSRLSDWYLAQTVAAMRLVYPDMVRLPTEFDDTGMRFEDVDAALAWLDDELGTLVALITATDAGQVRARSWELADQLRGYFFERRDAVPWLATGRAGLAAAEFADDHRAQAAMHQTIGQARWSVGKHELALESYQRGVTAAKRSGWLVGEAYLLHNLGLVHAELGRVDEAHELYERALKAGTGPEFTYVRAVILNDLGTVCTEQGRLVEAVDYFRAALEINERAGRGPAPMANHSNLGMVLRQLEAFHPAREHLETALAYNRETASLIGQVSVLDELSQLHQQLGEWCAAVDNATEALRIAKTLDDPKAEAGVMNSLGFALLGARAVTDAQTWFETSLRLSRERGYQYYEAQARIGVAAATLAIGAVEKARTAASEALEITRRRRYRVLEGDALVALTKATLATGDTLQAADYCQAAGASYRSGGLPGKIREVRQLAADIEAWTVRSLPVG